MSPTVAELIAGNARVMAEPTPPESAGAFSASKVGIVGMITSLVMQEIERGVSVRVTENRAIRALFAEAREWAPALSAKLADLAQGGDDDLTLSALDRANGALRTALIDLHATIEDQPDGQARERRIVRLLREMADARFLDLPGRRSASR